MSISGGTLHYGEKVERTDFLKGFLLGCTIKCSGNYVIDNILFYIPV